MKTPRIVPVYLLCLLFFASCSQRYGSRSYVKVNKKVEKHETTKAQKSVETSEDEFSVVEKESAPAPASTISPKALQKDKIQAETGLVKENSTLSKKEKKFTRRLEKRMNKVMEKLPEALAMTAPIPQNKRQNLNPGDNAENFQVSEHWLKIMIIGLVLLLVGILLPYPIGAIFYIVGSVLLVVGLIFLLLDLVD